MMGHTKVLRRTVPGYLVGELRKKPGRLSFLRVHVTVAEGRYLVSNPGDQNTGILQTTLKANALAPIAATRMTEDILPPEVFQKLTPEYVAPVMAYLCTEEVPDSASVFIVGGGKVQRVALFQNKGVTFDHVPSVDEVAAQWSTIDDLSSPEPAAFRL